MIPTCLHINYSIPVHDCHLLLECLVLTLKFVYYSLSRGKGQIVATG